MCDIYLFRVLNYEILKSSVKKFVKRQIMAQDRQGKDQEVARTIVHRLFKLRVALQPVWC